MEYTDEYFLNLTMDYDKRDDSIYPLWAVWCAKSEDKYYIDGKDGHFYTHVRTEQEIAVERKRREVLEMLYIQNKDIASEEEWQEYERYIYNNINDEEILNFIPMYFIKWKESK